MLRDAFLKFSDPAVLKRFYELDKANAHAFETELAGWAQMMQHGYGPEKDVAVTLNTVLSGIKSRYQLQIDTLESLIHVFEPKNATRQDTGPEPTPHIAQPLDLSQLNQMAASDTASEASFRLKVEGSQPLMMARRNQNNHASRLMQQEREEAVSPAKPACEDLDLCESKSTKDMGEYTLHYKMNDKTQRLNQILECNICHMSFPKLCNLRDHLRIHRGELPFSCGICGKKFTQAGNRDRHEKLRVCDKKGSGSQEED